MAKQRSVPRMTKKHLARAQREQIQRRWILISTIVTFGIALGFIAYGIYDTRFTPVAKVNRAVISANDFRSRVRLDEAITVSQQSSADLALSALENRQITADNALNDLIDEELIRQELVKRGVIISEEDVERTMGESFGYFSDGTPTPFPSSTPAPTFTPDPTLLALASITPTVTEGLSPTPSPTFTPGPSPTITPTRTPYPTPTLVTEEGYQIAFQDTVDRFSQINGVTEEGVRAWFRAATNREKLQGFFEDEIPKEQEFVHARHILVEDEVTAQEVLRLLEAGQAWEDLALEFSTDESNKAQGGDLDWFPRGQMIQEFETAAFNAQVGETVGPVESSFGWHLIQVLGKETRALSYYELYSLAAKAFNEWLTQARASAVIEKDLDLVEKMPPLPNLIRLFQTP